MVEGQVVAGDKVEAPGAELGGVVELCRQGESWGEGGRGREGEGGREIIFKFFVSFHKSFEPLIMPLITQNNPHSRAKN